MPGFNPSTRRRSGFTLPPPAASAPLAPITTHGGADAFARSPQADLFMLGVSFMVGEQTFYEAADARMDRFRALMRASLREDPVWTARFVGALRSVFNIRTASVVAAAELALAVRELPAAAGTRTPSARDQVQAELTAAGLSVRSVVDSALQRADEPAEFVAYWKLRTGRATLPGGVQRGVQDALRRLVREYTAIKYDGTASTVRLGDVIELAHPQPSTPWQDDLFRYLLDRRHHADAIQVPLQRLPMIETNRAWRQVQSGAREAMVAGMVGKGILADNLAAAGMTWEEFGSWLGRPLTADEREALIPSMGYMALLRHLRQFDEVGLSDEAAGRVAARLADPTEVARSRQFPYRFLTAYLQVPSDRWSTALEHALGFACGNLPALDGRSLVAVDTSASMENPVSAKSVVRRVDVGGLFATALAVKAQRVPGASVHSVEWATSVARHDVPRGASVLRQVRAFGERVGYVGHGTNLGLVAEQYTDHKRVVIFTDGQHLGQFGSARTVFAGIPAEVPVIVFNLGGYGNSVVDPAMPNRIELAGFTDAAFRLLAIMEAGPEGMAELVAPREIEDGGEQA